MALMQQVVYQSGAVDQNDHFQILDKVDSGECLAHYQLVDVYACTRLGYRGCMFCVRRNVGGACSHGVPTRQLRPVRAAVHGVMAS